MQSHRGAVGIIIICHDDRALARQRCVTIDVAAHRTCQHDPRQIIAGKNKWPFMRALCQNGLSGADFPQPLAWQMRWPIWQMVGDALVQRQIVCVHIAKYGGTWQHRYLGHAGQLIYNLSDPVNRRFAVNFNAGLGKQPTAKFILLIGNDNAGTIAGCL